MSGWTAWDAWKCGLRRPRWDFGRDPYLDIPLWIPLGAFAVPAVIAWARYRRRCDRTPGACARCGYDLAGLARRSSCPECGLHHTVASD